MRIQKIRCLAGIFLLGSLLSGCGTQPTAMTKEETAMDTAASVAAKEETVSQEDVVEEGMIPIDGQSLKDGEYSIQVDSSSNMFHITDCKLIVKDGAMQAVMTMSGTGYLKVFMGTGEEAARAEETDCIPFVESESGVHTFEIPVDALDQGIACSAYSKRKEKWYERVLVFRSDSLPTDAFMDGTMVTAESLKLEDGSYTAEVMLKGGSGRATVESPAKLRVKDGKVFASIVWGSPNYDYMKVQDEKFERIRTDGNSEFEIPVIGFDRNLSVIADTIAMSEPHEITYTLFFDSATLKKEEPAVTNWSEQKIDHSLELFYANQFAVDYYESGYKMITIQDSGRYLVLGKENEVPDGLPEDVTVIRQPLANIYLAATSAMDLFRSLDSVGQITLSGTNASGWYLNEAKEALTEGRMYYAGKYNAPDYELILSKGCDLAIESTMIFHSPEVKEQLEQLGIPVLVERSSYESHPLGRMEWLKLYGVLLEKEELADSLFQEQMSRLQDTMDQKPTGKTVAFFYITSNGSVNVRKPGDYVAKMIEMAGGSYVPQKQMGNENALSTMNMQMEAFYAAAKDADCIIYNSTIDGELNSLKELLEKSSLLADFKAVKEGNVWCTERNMFQETMGLGTMILDLHEILSAEEPDPSKLTYMRQLH